MRLWPAMLLLLPLPLGAAPPRAPASPDAAAVRVFVEQQLFERYPADGPGAAVLVARGDTVLFRGARGLASVELGVLLTPDHVFRIGSVTKQFAAVGLLKLVEAGKIGLDDALSSYLPEYPNGAKISVRQLLDHTSGIKSYTELPQVMGGMIRNDLTTAALIASFKDQPVSFRPGTQWAYNNSGYVLVGAVIEAASGKSWHAHLDAALLEPLGLQHTQYGANERLIPGMAGGYTVKDNAWAPMAFLSMTQPHAAGALVSTLDDLHAWNRALHEGKLLEPELYEAMTTPAGLAEPARYGFGIARGTLRGHLKFDHSGGIFGFASYLLYVPNTQLSVVVLQNADATLNGKGDPGQLAALTGAFALGDPFSEAKPIAVEAQRLQEAEGVYRIDASNRRVLRIVDGQLTAQRSGGERMTLLPIGPDRFLYEGSLTEARLERDVAGKIIALRVVHDGEGEGEQSPRSEEPLPAARQAILLDAAQIERVLGAYKAGELRMRVYVERGQLKAQLDGQPAFELHAESASTFFLTAVDATLVFAPETGQAQALSLQQGGSVIGFERGD